MARAGHRTSCSRKSIARIIYAYWAVICQSFVSTIWPTGLGFIIAQNSTDPESFLTRHASNYAWEGPLIKNGACYLSAVPPKFWLVAYMNLGLFPVYARAKRYMVGGATFKRVGRRLLHASSDGRATPYGSERVGASSNRHRRLSAEIYAGLPAASPIGDGRFTSDYEVLQPSGIWSMEGENMYHYGHYVDPIHAPSRAGWCYLAIFQDRYQAVAEGRLGRWPRTRALQEFALKHQHFLKDGRYVLELAIVDCFIRAHITGPDNTNNNAMSPTRLLDIIPKHKTCVGGVTIQPRNSAEVVKGRGYRKEIHYPSELLTELRAGLVTSTPLGKGVHTSDHHVLQSWGEWHEIDGILSHTGPFHYPFHSPDKSGYCYLLCFQPRYQAVAIGRLGKYPHADEVLRFAQSHQRWLDVRAGLVVEYDTDHSREWAPMLTHIKRKFGGIHNGASIARWALKGRVGGIIVGTAGRYIDSAVVLPGETVEENGVYRRKSMTMGRPDQVCMRDASYNTFHNLSLEVFESALGEDVNMLESTEFLKIFDSAVASLATISRTWQTGDRVVVTGWPWASNSTTSIHPGETVTTATRGLVFCSSVPERFVHPAWDVIQVPLEPYQGRLLASLRLLPLVTGRSDVDVCIVNSRTPQRGLRCFEFFEHAGVAALSSECDWSPVWFGGFAAQGCVWGFDFSIARSFFGRYGLIYGADEAFAYVRNPFCYPNKARAGVFDCMTTETTFANVSYFPPSLTMDDQLWRCHASNAWKINDIISAAAGNWPQSSDLPSTTVNHFRDVYSLANQARFECDIAGIPVHGASKQLSRRGGRYSHAQVTPLEKGVTGYNAIGGVWRPYDVAFGARSRLRTDITQGLDPRLWGMMTFADPKIEVDDIIMQAILEGERRVKEFAASLHPGICVGVASVWSKTMLENYADTRKEFDHWIWLTEDDTITPPDANSVVVHLPRWMGVGFHFQLARLIAATAGRHDVFFSCVNDLETDWMPRSERLSAGRECMPWFDMVFPAMGLNCPCPFQDVYGRMDALSAHPEKLESWRRVVSSLGFLYGIDEIWAAAWGFPTVAVRWELGAGATPSFSNPIDNLVIRLVDGGLQGYIACGGNFKSLFTRGIQPFTIAPPEATGDLSGLSSVAIPERIGGATWDAMTRHDVANQVKLGMRHIAIFVWGTRGDRIPLLFAAKTIRKAGVMVTVVELNTTSQGERGLSLCETGKGLYLTPSLLHSSQIVARTLTPNLAPVYLWSGGKSLSYDLAPNPKYGGHPRGGLPPYIDWLVPFITSRWTRHIRIGAYRGAEWFPRSSDGESSLPRSPITTPRPVRRGRVGGSSSIPVPPEYESWETIPPGDHFHMFQDYTEIACAGGAGVVQTIAMAGAKAIAWDDSIDRQYADPSDAGRGVNGNEPDSKWWVVIPHFYPSFSFIRHPLTWFRYLRFQAVLMDVVRIPWQVLFVMYSFRKWHPQPTIQATISRNVFGTDYPVLAMVMSAAIRSLWIAWGEQTGLSAWKRTRFAITAILAGVTSGALSTLALCGVNTRKAILLSALYESLPSFMSVLANVKTGYLTKGASRSVWVGMNPVWYKNIPVGFHATLYCPETGTLYQGVHRREPDLGSSFVAHRSKRDDCKALLWAQTSLSESDLIDRTEVSGAYSAWFNCQALVVMKLYTTGAHNTTPLITLLLVGLASGHAFVFLATSAFLVAVFSSMGAIATFALTPFFKDKTVPREMVNVFVRAASRAITPWFADETRPEPDQKEDATLAEDMRDLKNLSSLVVEVTTEAIRSGVDQDSAFEAAAMTMIRSLEDDSPVADPIEGDERSVKEKVGVMEQLMKNSHIPLPLIQFAVRLGFSIVEQTWEATAFTSALIGVFCSFIEKRWQVDILPDLRGLLANSVHNYGKSLRLKNAWAPLFGKHVDRLRPVDWISAGVEEWKLQDHDDHLHQIIMNINEHCPPGQDPIDLQQQFVRKSRLPWHPRVSAKELEYSSLLSSVAYSVDPELTARSEKYLSLGGKQGIDGMWLASDENRETVNARYLATPRTTLAHEEQLAEQVADMLYESHSEAFTKPGVVTPETVRNQLVKKYSPGLPLLCRFKRRSQLISTGWMDAMIQATYRRLELGEYPPQAYHEFAKMQVVTKLRTVVAQDLASYFVDQVVQLERNKRPFWLQANMGMGAPLRTGYLGEVFSRVAERNVKFSADVTAYDANTPPVIFHVLTRLAEKGVSNGGVPLVANVLRKKYIAMQNAVIVDLPTGSVMEKRRGGGTGQSATSWDNHWGMRAAMIMIWSVVTGLPPRDFYLTNTVHNTGDDNIWGTDDELDPDHLSRAAKEWLGLDLRVERRGDITDLTYLGKQILASEAIPEKHRLPLPKFVAAPLREQFLLRRSAINSRFSGLPDVKYYEKLVERSIGHAQNCAFDQELYSMVAHEYMEEASAYFSKTVKPIWRIKSGPQGYVEGVSFRIPKDQRMTPRMRERLGRLRKELRLPTYTEVISKDVCPAPKIKEESKFAYATVPIGWERILRSTIATARIRFNQALPDVLVKLAGKSDMAPVAPLFWVLGYPVETFVWRTMYHETGTIPSFDNFVLRCRRSPFSSATDPVSFTWWSEQPDNRKHLMEGNVKEDKGRMFIAFAWYVIIDKIYSWITFIPLVGVLVELSKVWRFDLPRLFSILSSLYWLDTADSSAVISAMMPADPFGFEKKISVWISALTPKVICVIIGALWPIQWTAVLSDLVGKITTATSLVAFKNPPGVPTNRWAGPIASEILTKLKFAGARGLAVTAPTATGKSTQLPAAIIEATNRRVWLVVPRVVLRSTYGNPWIDRRLILRASRGVPIGREPLVVCTYGHFNARLSHGSISIEDDIVLLDEFHEEEPEMGATSWYLRNHRSKAFLSATPSLRYATSCDHLKVDLDRPFEEPTPIRLALPVVQLFQVAARDHPQEIKRSLVIVSSIKDCEMVCASIVSMGYVCSTLNRLGRDVPVRGVIVATQIVDSGIDIDPPVNIVVDGGERIVVDRGRTKRQASDPSTDIQRRGRAGRRGKGWSYTTLNAATGPRPTIYPVYTRVVDDPSLRGFLFDNLGITDELEDVPGAVRFDSRVQFPTVTSGADELGLACWWLLICSERTPHQAALEYDQITISGWLEHHDGIRNLLIKWYGRDTPPLRASIQKWTDTPSFTIQTKGIRRFVGRLFIQDGKLDGV